MIRKIEFAQAQLHDLEKIHRLIDELVITPSWTSQLLCGPTLGRRSLRQYH
jgi:hypothetical protein